MNETKKWRKSGSGWFYWDRKIKYVLNVLVIGRVNTVEHFSAIKSESNAISIVKQRRRRRNNTIIITKGPPNGNESKVRMCKTISKYLRWQGLKPESLKWEWMENTRFRKHDNMHLEYVRVCGKWVDFLFVPHTHSVLFSVSNLLVAIKLKQISPFIYIDQS